MSITKISTSFVYVHIYDRRFSKTGIYKLNVIFCGFGIKTLNFNTVGSAPKIKQIK